MRIERNGLLMIGASLLVMTIVVGLVARREIDLRFAQMRTQGISLSGTLSRIPLSRLAPADGHIGALPLVRSMQADSLFAYALVVDTAGETLGMVSTENLAPLASAIPENPTEWNQERTLMLGDPPVPVREFTAPVMEDGRVVAQIRIGYFEPGYSLALPDASFHAALALLVFLLTPVAYLWLRREIRPLREVAQHLDAEAGSYELPTETGGSPSQAIESVVDRFRAFSSEMEQRTEAMRRERVALLASSKVLAHERNRVQVVFEALPDGILVLDETGRVLVANARSEAILRKSREELVGSATGAWSPAAEVTQLIGRYSGAAGRLQRSESVEFAIEELGERRFVASVQPLPDASGSSVLLREITSEFVARKTQAEFLAHMAHELKAPLNVMGMYSESLLGPEASDESFRIDACNVIRDEIDRLNGLINNIFSIGRIESGHVSLSRQRIRLREMLSDVLESVSRGGDELGLEFVLEVPDSMTPVYADKHMLSIALKNILTNAVKYNRPGGKVSLIAEEASEGLYIKIADTGVGIPEEEVDLVFDKFYRSESESVQKVAGHGLGLALVKEIISLHGGEIQVQSVLGEGSEFGFFFARHAAIFREESGS